MNSPHAIACHDLCKFFGEARAVENTSFELEKGDFLALVGPSGCGKTTILRMIAGLERPDSGKIVLNGKPVSDNRVYISPNNRRVGLVFQDYALFPHMTVEKNIAYGLPSHERSRVAELLELVGLIGMEKRYPQELSCDGNP